jgi:hypothetical protein
VALDLGRGPDGKRIRKWHSGYRTKRLAEVARVELLASLDQSTTTLCRRLGTCRCSSAPVPAISACMTCATRGRRWRSRQRSPPAVVQERLGHASIAITLGTYPHVAPGMGEQAAATVAALVLGGTS